MINGFNRLLPSDAVRIQKNKNSLEDPFSSVLSQFKKYRLSENLKFNNLSIFQNLKLRILMEKILPIFSKAKFHSKYSGVLWVKRRDFKGRGWLQGLLAVALKGMRAFVSEEVWSSRQPGQAAHGRRPSVAGPRSGRAAPWPGRTDPDPDQAQKLVPRLSLRTIQLF